MSARERERERMNGSESARERSRGEEEGEEEEGLMHAGNRHAFKFLISCTSSYISIAAILRFIRIFGWWPAQVYAAFTKAWRVQSLLNKRLFS